MKIPATNNSYSQITTANITNNFGKTTMRTLIAIFLLTIFFSCSDRQRKNSDTQKNDSLLVITAIDAIFPLKLDDVNFEDKHNLIHLNDGIVSKIEETIKEYAKDIEFYDSAQTYRDTYINTIQLHDSLQTIYLVLLKHYPTGALNSKALFYDNKKKVFTEQSFDFNLSPLYNFDNGKLTPTNLKKDFKITSPEIELIDFNKDGINDYKFKRLWHNGTFNAIHTRILTVKNSTIDTLYFCEKGLGELAEKKSCL